MARTHPNLVGPAIEEGLIKYQDLEWICRHRRSQIYSRPTLISLCPRFLVPRPSLFLSLCANCHHVRLSLFRRRGKGPARCAGRRRRLMTSTHRCPPANTLQDTTARNTVILASTPPPRARVISATGMSHYLFTVVKIAHIATSPRPSVEKRTPPRRPHLRSLDLASASPPSTPSYLSPAFSFAPKSAGITRTVTTRATSYAASLSESLSLAALNLDPSSADELSDEASVSNDYVDLNDSPTLKLRPLPHARSSISSSLANSMESPSKATNFPSLTASPHRREFFPRSPARVPALATPPLTPSSSFASADTTRSEHDEQDSEAEDRSPASWYDVRRSETFKHAFQPVEYDDRDGAQMVSFNTEVRPLGCRAYSILICVHPVCRVMDGTSPGCKAFCDRTRTPAPFARPLTLFLSPRVQHQSGVEG